MNKKYKKLTSNLIKNFNNIKNNNFILPNKTKLNKNTTKTKKNIFYNFKQHYKFIFILNFYH